MYRFILGISILAGLLLLCLGVGLFANSSHEPICRDLEKAARLALEGDAGNSLILVEQARHRWNQLWHRTAAFSEHEPMDEIDSLFAQLEAYRQDSSQISAAGLCLRLSQLIDAISDAQSLTWWNLL